MSELVFALRDRPEGERGQLCVFVDEFHNFASSDHMAIMTTEGRKFGVAATYLHVERFGQLAHNQKLMGATQAIVNKGMFQATVNDANEFAPEYAKEPTTTEVRLEPELVVSQEPFWDMLQRGHANPKIQIYIYKYIQPLKDGIDFYKQEIENSKLVRMELIDLASLYRDEAAIARVDEAMDRIITESTIDVGGQVSALNSAHNALENAQKQREQLQYETIILKGDYTALKNGIAQIRKVGRFLTKIMYEHIQLRPEQEDLAQTLCTILITALCNEKHLDFMLSRVYQLYLECRFGDPFKPRTIPTQLALRFRTQLIEEAYLHNKLERIKERQQQAEEELRHNKFKYQSDREYAMRVITEEYKNSQLEEATQLFRSCFNPSETVVDYYNISIKIPDEPSTIPIIRLKQSINSYEEKLPLKCLPRVYTQEEITEITRLCETILKESIQTEKSSPHVFTAIDEMLDFFNLLSKPENHIRVPSGQYVEKHVNVRPVHDMTNEIAQELGRLPRFQAYIKLIDEVANKQVVRTHRIETHPLPEIQSMETESQAIANGHTLGRKRIEIEAEIRERQKRWLPGSDKPTTRGR